MIAKLLRWWRDRPDPCAVMQTPRPSKWEGYDQAKAVSGRLLALERARAARKVADGYATRKADVVRIDSRRVK